QMNATSCPSGDQTGEEGCLMSMSCSMVRRGLVWATPLPTNAAITKSSTTRNPFFDSSTDASRAKGGCDHIRLISFTSYRVWNSLEINLQANACNEGVDGVGRKQVARAKR